MSWSPQPTLGGQNWAGNAPLATARQLVSSISSIQSQISSIIASDVSSVNQSTGTVSSLETSQLWNRSSIIVSTPTLITNALSSQSVLTSSLTSNTANFSTLTLSSIFANTLSGALTGNVSGNLTGNTNGAVTATSLTATGAIDFRNNSIRQFSGGYTSTGGIAINSYQNIQVKASTNIALLADRGADITGTASIDLTAQYGGASRINLSAKSASALAITPTAQVNITAEGNSTVAPSYVPVGGAVNITAKSGSGEGAPLVGYGQVYITAESFNQTTQPGFIAHSAGANAMYAGTFSPFAGLGQAYGNNYIWGQAGNSFVCSPTTPTFPAVVGSNYFYAALGALGGYSVQIAGNRMRGGIGTDFIQPFPTLGDLYIQGDQAGNMIQISSVKVLNMSTTGAITGVGNINLSSINGGPYVSTIPSTVSVVLLNASSLIASTASISTLTTGTINLSSINGGPYISTIPSTVSVVLLNASSLIASTGSISTLTTGNINLSTINNLPYTDPAGNAPYLSSFTVSTGTLTASTITATTFVSTKSLVASTLTTTELTATLGSISSLTVSSLSAGILTGSTIINSIITNNVLTSTMTNTGGIIFTTPSTIFDLSKTTTLSSVTATQVAQYRNKILTYELDATATTELVVTYVAPQSQIFYFQWDQVGTWGGVTNTFLAGQPYIRVNIGVFGTAPESGFIDIYNSNQSTGLDVYYFAPYHTLVALGATVRFSWVSQGASIGTWTVTPSPSISTITTQTNFNITQGYADTTIAGSDIVNINATSLYLNAPLTQAQRIYATDGYYSTLQTQFISTGVIRVNTISSASVSVTGDLTATGTITAPIMSGTFYANAPLVYGTTAMITPLVSTNLINITSANPNAPTSVTAFTETITTQLPATSISSRYNVSEVDYNLSFVRPVYNQTLGTANVVTIRPDYTLYVNGTYTGVNAISTVINFTPVDNSSIINISTFAFNGSFTAQTNNNAIPFTFAGTTGSVLANTYKEFRYISPTLTTPSGAKPSPWLSPTAAPSQLQVSLGANQLYVSTPTIFFNNKQIQTFTINCPGTIENNGLYGKGTGQSVASFNGQTFRVADYNCLASIANVNIYGQVSLAINEQAITTSANVDGNWYIQTTITTATIPNATHPAFDFFVGLTMIPKELGGATNFQSPAHLGEESWSPMNIPGAILSSITASTLTFEATENIALVANVAVPSFVSTGSIYIAGTNNTNLLGNITAVGGYTDVDIDALAGDVNITATAGDINLSANGQINVGPSIIRGSNTGSMLGNFQPMKFVYEPPTATGQSAEFAIQAHPQDAGVVFNLRYGVNLAGGYGYLLCEWPGYIVVPMKIYGQDIALEGGETVHINANSGNITLHATGSVVTDAPINMSNHNINSTNTIQTTTITNNPANSDYLTLTATSSITLTASNALVFNSADGNYFNSFVTLTGTAPLFMNGNGIYCQNGFITQLAELYFKQGGSITSFQSGGVNYIDINPPPTTGSGTGQLRFYGQKGTLIFDDNVALGGNGSNYVGMYNQYGFVQIASDQNVHIGGGGGNIGGLNIIYMYEFTTIRHTGVVGTGALGLEVRNNGTRNVTPGDLQGSIYVHAAVPNATGESGSQITLDVEGNYGGAIFGGVKQGWWGFLGLYTNNGSGTQTERMRIRADNGYVGINTTIPYYMLDVIGDTRVAGNLYANNDVTVGGTVTTVKEVISGASDIARLILGPSPGPGNYDYCSLIQSESNVASNYSSQLSFWTHPSAGNYGDPVRRMTIDAGGNVVIATGSLYMSGNTIEMGGTSSNAAYISGLNHIYGQPTTAGGYFGGMIIDYMGGQFYNGGGNDAGIYCEASSHVLSMYNTNADISIDAHTHGINLYGAGMNINLPTTLQASSYLDLNSKTVYGAKQIGFFYGGTLSTAIPGGHTNADITLTGTGGDSAINMVNGTAEVQVNANNDVVITPASGKNILLNGPVTTVLSSTAIRQPVIQYGETTGSGTSGSATVTLPTAYTSSTSYVVFASMMDTTECKISVNRDSSSQITIYWSQGGSGSHSLGWNTMGT